ncbi:MAG: hypothetical protein QMC81_08830 [Thermoanaerobacterales bacterium]|nr:hypothetical protein [Bacillota bacterium]MDI6907572.1 hypothetical protein [Thermoanaerobacterales bacterium]
MRKVLWFLARTYVATRLWPAFKRRAGERVRYTFSIRNLFGENAGTWWEMRKTRLK